VGHVAAEEEQVTVWRNRYIEARKAGLEHTDALRYAHSDADIAQLRSLVAGGCAPKLIARIVL